MRSVFKSKKLAIIVSYALICTNVLSNLILTPIYLNYLGTDGYGFYQMIYAVASYILILDLGIGNHYGKIYFYLQRKKRLKREKSICFLFCSTRSNSICVYYYCWSYSQL